MPKKQQNNERVALQELLSASSDAQNLVPLTISEFDTILLPLIEDPKYAIEVNHSPSARLKSPKEMAERALKFFNKCVELNRPITMSGTVLALGLAGRSSLQHYVGLTPEFDFVIAIIRNVWSQYAEQMLYTKWNNGARFSLQNQGWSEHSTIVTETKSFNININSQDDELPENIKL